MNSLNLKDSFYKELGKRLKTFRKAKGLTQNEVAKELGITCQQYQKYESGKNKIPVHSLYHFCNLTGVSIYYLFSSPLTVSK